MDNNGEKAQELMFARTIYLTDFYGQEARRCRSAGAYLAGCVMLGAAAEAALILFIQNHELGWDDSDAEFKNRLGLGVAKLLGLIRGWGWLNQEESRQRNDLNECLDKMRRIRNLVHPGCCLRDPPNVKVDATQFDELHNSVAELLNYVEECMVQDFEQTVRNMRYTGRTFVSMFGAEIWTEHDEMGLKEMEEEAKCMRAGRTERKRNWLWNKAEG